MAITAAMIKQLRARTGAGMLDCKNALRETNGDLPAAIAELRKKGAAAAEKRADRVTAEGVIAAAHDSHGGVLVEVNCETDFVAKDAAFNAFAQAVAAAALSEQAKDVTALANAPFSDGDTVEVARQQLSSKMGENIGLRRVAYVAGEGDVSIYLHATRIGTMVKLHGGDAALGHDLAMHIAASNPLCISEQEIPADVLAKEKEIYTAQAEQSGKPPAIVEKMVAGRVQKFLQQNTLLGQAFVKDTEQSVGQLLQSRNALVEYIVRYAVGEGVEKVSDDFVAEVVARARG